jgi:hypothetical protein
VIGNGKKIGFTFTGLDVSAAFPELFKSGLHHVPCVLFMAEVLQDKPIDVIRVARDTIIEFFLSHKQLLSGKGKITVIPVIRVDGRKVTEGGEM